MTPNSLTITPRTASLINKALAGLAIAAFAIAAVTVFPSFGPNTEANAAPVLIKADKLVLADPTCAEQNWPNYNASCLHTPSNAVVKVRHVTTDRL